MENLEHLKPTFISLALHINRALTGREADDEYIANTEGNINRGVDSLQKDVDFDNDEGLARIILTRTILHLAQHHIDQHAWGGKGEIDPASTETQS